jgi:hypothetical protein
MYIDEIEELGIKILVLYHLGLMPDIDKVDFKNDTLVLSFFVPNEYKDAFDYELNDNPLLFIPNSIESWYDEYSYYEKYPAAARSYDDVNPKYWTTTKLYDKLISNLSDYARENKKTQKESTSSKNKLRDKIKRRS